MIAALLYNSWPLGFWLNYPTSVHGLASDLERVHHPYYWVFIAGDLLASLIISVIAINELGKKRGRRANAYALMATGLLIFAVFTVGSTILPSDCNVTPILRCRVIQDNGLGIDALTSTIAALGLSASLLGVVYLDKLKRIKGVAHYATLITLLLWVTSGTLFLYLGLSNMSVRVDEWALLLTSGLIILLSGHYFSQGFSPKQKGAKA